MLLLSRTFVGVCAGKHVQATFCAVVLLHHVIESRLISCHTVFTACKPLLSLLYTSCERMRGGVLVCHGSLVLSISSGAWPFLVGGVICLVNSVNERDLNRLNSRTISESFCDFLEGLLMFNQSQEGNNRSVMPLDVLGRTRATLSDAASLNLNRKVWVIFSKSDVMGIDHCNY